MRWITQEKPQVDRLSTAWLIRRFVDPEAEFAFVPRGTEASSVKDGTPFYLAGAELGKRDGRSSFQAVLDKYQLGAANPVLQQLGLILRAADEMHGPVVFRHTPVMDALPASAPPQTAGLQALVQGISLVAANDLDAIDRATTLFDELYAALQAQSGSASRVQQTKHGQS